MKFLVAFLLVLSSGFFSAQTFYLTGRPFSFERNNAMVEAATKWGFSVAYVGGDLMETMGMDSINALNESFITKRGGKLKGEDWLASYFVEVDVQEKRHQDIRRALNTSNYILSAKKAYREVYIMVQNKPTEAKRFDAFVLGIASQGQVVCTQKLSVKSGRRVRFKPVDDCQIPYEIPQNGIVNTH